jgi:hypothetical protein
MHQEGRPWRRAWSDGRHPKAWKNIPAPLQPGDLRFLARLMQFPRVVIPHSDPRVGVRGSLLHIPQRHTRVQTAVTNACLRVIHPALCRSSRRPSAVRKMGPSQRSPGCRGFESHRSPRRNRRSRRLIGRSAVSRSDRTRSPELRAHRSATWRAGSSRHARPAQPTESRACRRTRGSACSAVRPPPVAKPSSLSGLLCTCTGCGRAGTHPRWPEIRRCEATDRAAAPIHSLWR